MLWSSVVHTRLGTDFVSRHSFSERVKILSQLYNAMQVQIIAHALHMAHTRASPEKNRAKYNSYN